MISVFLHFSLHEFSDLRLSPGWPQHACTGVPLCLFYPMCWPFPLSSYHTPASYDTFCLEFACGGGKACPCIVLFKCSQPCSRRRGRKMFTKSWMCQNCWPSATVVWLYVTYCFVLAPTCCSSDWCLGCSWTLARCEVLHCGSEPSADTQLDGSRKA